MTPERIYGVLTTGVMQPQAASLSDPAKRAIAEYLGDRKLGARESGAVEQMPNRCEPSRAPRPGVAARLERLGRGPREHALPAGAGRAACRRSRCRAWPCAGRSLCREPRRSTASRRPWTAASSSAPTPATSTRSISGPAACTGRSRPQAGVRSAVTIGPIAGGAPGRVLRRSQGQRLRARRHAPARWSGPGAWTTTPWRGSPRRPVLYRDRLYVSVASWRGGRQHQPAVSVLHVPRQRAGAAGRHRRRGVEDLHHRRPASADAACRRRASRCMGRPAPACGTPPPSIRGATRSMSAPATTTRGPTTPASDAVMAMDLDTGKVLWTQQVLADDAWIPACAAGARAGRQLPREHRARLRLRRVADPEDDRRRPAAAHHRGQERRRLGDGPRSRRRGGVEDAAARHAGRARRARWSGARPPTIVTSTSD